MFYPACGEGRELDRFRNSLKNARDSFDSHLSNGRRGWLNADHETPGQLGTVPAAILAAWRDRPNSELWAEIKKLLSGNLDLEQLRPEAGTPPTAGAVRPKRARVLRASRPSAAAGARSERTGIRRSVEAKRVGDCAELIVKEELLRSLSPTAAETLVHHAAIGETPGYDLSYSLAGELFAVEVKGTVSDSMDSFEITAGEVRAARRLGSRYHLYLVAKVDSDSPLLEVFEGLGEGFALSPTRFAARRRVE